MYKGINLIIPQMRIIHGITLLLYMLTAAFIGFIIGRIPQQMRSVEIVSAVARSSSIRSKQVFTAQPTIIKTTKTWIHGQPLPTVDITRVLGRKIPLLPSLNNDGDWVLPPVPELKGQVTLETSFGQELYRLAKLPEVHLVMEIGTWFGGGSSWCIAQV